jgi:lysophospholipase-3
VLTAAGRLLSVVLTLIALLVLTLVPSTAAAAGARVTPVVLFPAYHLTRLKIDVHNQTVATEPECPPIRHLRVLVHEPR